MIIIRGGISTKLYNLIKIRAYSFHQTTGIPYDELISEGLLCYTICLYKYDKNSNVKFTTYLYRALDNHYINFSKYWKKQIPAETWDGEVFPDVPYHDNFEKIYSLRQQLNLLSPEAQGVLDIMESCQDEIVKRAGKKVKNPYSPKHVKGALTRFLKEIGWTRNIIEKTYNEISNMIGEFTVC